jgi:hypothetical protein
LFNPTRVQQGDEYPLRVRTLGSAETLRRPTAAPLAEIYDASTGTLVWSGQLPPQSPRSVVGAFMYRLLLEFPVGVYAVVYTYFVGAEQMVKVEHFQIVEGGNAKGEVIAGVWTTQPTMRHIIMETITGDLFKGGNPIVS